jgi:hypothetical protein
MTREGTTGGQPRPPEGDLNRSFRPAKVLVGGCAGMMHAMSAAS